MRQNLLRVLTTLTLCLSVISISFAQNRKGTNFPVSDIYKISANAGGVNLVDGKVTAVRVNGKSGLVIKGEIIAQSDIVTTSANGKAEILLNPGSYLRLSENSEFEFTNSSLDNLQIKLTRGSAIMEVITNSDDGFVVGVQTPQNKAFIIDSGVYRFDVLADGTSQVEVWKGKIQTGTTKSSIIKGGKTATFKDSQVSVAKFDRDKKDSFEVWSKARAKDLSVANAGLVDRTGLRSSLMSGFYGSSWNAFDSYGVWVLNMRSGGWCFMPFGYGWNSPYGFGFNNWLGYYNLPYQIIYSNPPVNNGSGSSSSVKPPVTRGDGRPIRVDSDERKPIVTDTDRGARQTPVVDVFKPGRGSTRDESPIFSPPSSRTDRTPIIISPPASTDRKPNN